MASTASRCISITRSIGSRLRAKPSNGPRLAACSEEVKYACPCMMAVMAPARARPSSESYGRPAAMISEPMLAKPSPSGRNLWLFRAMRSVG